MINGMAQLLVLVVYERLMPGSQLINRLQDLGYRVLSLTRAGELVELARREKPLLVIADLPAQQQDVCLAIATLRQQPDTSHIPIIAIADATDPRLEATAREAGATLVVSEAAIQVHLTQLIAQALQV
jgi:PleD family two-component response regulator